jgi:glutamate dehydrogenase (NADP+)
VGRRAGSRSIKQLSATELERLSRGYIAAVADAIGPDVDVPAPTSPPASWSWDGWRTSTPRSSVPHVPAVLTGKPLALGGIPGRSSATSDGAFHVIDQLHDRLLDEIEHPTVAIQGLRERRLAAGGLARGRGLPGRRGQRLRPRRSTIPTGSTWMRCVGTSSATGSLADAPVGAELDPAKLLALDVDLLVPAALEGAIHADNAADVRARVVVEVANGPVTSEADAVLDDAGVALVPDILANAGGVTVSWFEWVQNRSGDSWEAMTVRERLEQRMVRETRHVQRIADERKVPLRVAAYVVALERLAAAMEATGTAAIFAERRVDRRWDQLASAVAAERVTRHGGP